MSFTPSPQTNNTVSSRHPRRLAGALLTAAFLVTGVAGVASGQAIGGAKPLEVGMKSLKFTPEKAKAKVGQNISFVWKENVAHNVVIDNAHKSKTQSKGAWTTKFDKAGTYKYTCTIHPGMKGELTITK